MPPKIGYKLYMRQRRAAIAAAGKCIQCGRRKPVKGATKCGRCRALAQVSDEARRARIKAEKEERA